jgi:hypothetical protein
MSERHAPGYMPWDRTGNRLLVKSELAKSKPSNYEIPESNFVYGKNTYEDPEQANLLKYRWKYHDPSHNQNHLKVKDLIETNQQSLKGMLHTSSQFSDFRKTNTQYKTAREDSNVIKINLPDERHTYGKPSSKIHLMQTVGPSKTGNRQHLRRRRPIRPTHLLPKPDQSPHGQQTQTLMPHRPPCHTQTKNNPPPSEIGRSQTTRKVQLGKETRTLETLQILRG